MELKSNKVQQQLRFAKTLIRTLEASAQNTMSIPALALIQSTTAICNGRWKIAQIIKARYEEEKTKVK